jgi:hypothetical protein
MIIKTFKKLFLPQNIEHYETSMIRLKQTRREFIMRVPSNILKKLYKDENDKRF